MQLETSSFGGKKALQEAFKLLDIRGDGAICVDEVIKFCKSIENPPTENDVCSTFRSLDTDGSGTITLDEFEKFCFEISVLCRTTVQKMCHLFKQDCLRNLYSLVDNSVNPDGVLELEEIARFLEKVKGLIGEEALEFIEEKYPEDAVLQMDEFCSLIEELANEYTITQVAAVYEGKIKAEELNDNLAASRRNMDAPAPPRQPYRRRTKKADRSAELEAENERLEREGKRRDEEMGALKREIAALRQSNASGMNADFSDQRAAFEIEKELFKKEAEESRRRLTEQLKEVEVKLRELEEAKSQLRSEREMAIVAVPPNPKPLPTGEDSRLFMLHNTIDISGMGPHLLERPQPSDAIMHYEAQLRAFYKSILRHPSQQGELQRKLSGVPIVVREFVRPPIMDRTNALFLLLRHKYNAHDYVFERYSGAY